MNYEIVNLNQLTVVGISAKTTNQNGKSATDIGKTWQKFVENNLMSKIHNPVNGKGIGLYYDYEGDATMPYSFLCGMEVSKPENADLVSVVISNGKYAKFSIKGHMVKSVQKAWSEIWNMDLDRKYDFDFEVYHNDSNDMDNQSIDIYISIN